MAESERHRRLKDAAAAWARSEGYRAVGKEVRLPRSPFRADVVACAMDRPQPGELVISRTAAFECKQSRPDFLSDALPEEGMRARLRQLHRRRRRLEDLVASHYPTLLEGESLFPEFRTCDPGRIRHRGYRRLTREIRRLENGIGGRTKFSRVIRYRCVDLCYLVVSPGIVEADEVPSLWGILEAEDEPETRTPVLQLVRSPHWIGSPPAHRLELLFALAARNGT